MMARLKLALSFPLSWATQGKSAFWRQEIFVRVKGDAEEAKPWSNRRPETLADS
jgi:hypothetical protein